MVFIEGEHIYDMYVNNDSIVYNNEQFLFNYMCF